MSVKTAIHEKDGLYFITFTCQGWLPLFELTNSYDLVYNWFDCLTAQGHFICGYVILPNHLHALIGFCSATQSINTIVSNGKRFYCRRVPLPAHKGYEKETRRELKKTTWPAQCRYRSSRYYLHPGRLCQ